MIIQCGQWWQWCEASSGRRCSNVGSRCGAPEPSQERSPGSGLVPGSSHCSSPGSGLVPARPLMIHPLAAIHVLYKCKYYCWLSGCLCLTQQKRQHSLYFRWVAFIMKSGCSSALHSLARLQSIALSSPSWIGFCWNCLRNNLINLQSLTTMCQIWITLTAEKDQFKHHLNIS